MNIDVPRARHAAILALLLVPAAACDIVTADLKHSESTEWRKSYELQPGGRVEVSNVNGKIEVEPASGKTVEVVAVKSAKGHSAEAAKQALGRVDIIDQSGPDGVRVQTKYLSGQSWFSGGATVQYTVRVPAGAEVKFTTTNGGVELRGLSGTIEASSTNGGVVAREISGAIDATTTNGGVDVDLAHVAEGGARLSCTNGGIVLRIPSNAHASINASITNGGVEAEGLQLETIESSKRKLQARLNGGGPQIRISGTNGGVRIRAR